MTFINLMGVVVEKMFLAIVRSGPKKLLLFEVCTNSFRTN